MDLVANLDRPDYHIYSCHDIYASGVSRGTEAGQRGRLFITLLQRITESTCQVMLFDNIQYFAYWWSSTFEFIPPRILPPIIGRHREAYDDAQNGKADIECDTFDVSRPFVVREAKGSQYREALADGIEHA